MPRNSEYSDSLYYNLRPRIVLFLNTINPHKQTYEIHKQYKWSDITQKQPVIKHLFYFLLTPMKSVDVPLFHPSSTHHVNKL